MSDPRLLSEYESKTLLRPYGVPVTRESLAADPESAGREAAAIGFPVALKLCAEGLAHKTERGLVRLGLGSTEEVEMAARELLDRGGLGDGEAGLLVQEMVSGRRELIAGVFRDPQFGPCVMLGAGGVFAELFRDVVFRLAPLDRHEALEMMTDLRSSAMLDEFRGEPAMDRGALADVLVGLGRLATEREDVLSVDVNPLIVHGSSVVAVDALVECSTSS